MSLHKNDHIDIPTYVTGNRFLFLLWEPSEIFFNSYGADNAAFSEAILVNFPECLMAECLVVNWFGS